MAANQEAPRQIEEADILRQFALAESLVKQCRESQDEVIEAAKHDLEVSKNFDVRTTISGFAAEVSFEDANSREYFWLGASFYIRYFICKDNEIGNTLPFVSKWELEVYKNNRFGERMEYRKAAEFLTDSELKAYNAEHLYESLAKLDPPVVLGATTYDETRGISLEQRTSFLRGVVEVGGLFREIQVVSGNALDRE